MNTEHLREARCRFVELVPAARATRTKDVAAVAHPLVDGRGRAGADVRISHVEHLVFFEPTGCQVFLGQHVYKPSKLHIVSSVGGFQHFEPHEHPIPAVPLDARHGHRCKKQRKRTRAVNSCSCVHPLVSASEFWATRPLRELDVFRSGGECVRQSALRRARVEAGSAAEVVRPGHPPRRRASDRHLRISVHPGIPWVVG